MHWVFTLKLAPLALTNHPSHVTSTDDTPTDDTPTDDTHTDDTQTEDIPTDDTPTDDTPTDDTPTDATPTDDTPTDDTPTDDTPTDDNPTDDNPTDDTPTDVTPTDDTPTDDTTADDTLRNDTPSYDTSTSGPPTDDTPTDSIFFLLPSLLPAATSHHLTDLSRASTAPCPLSEPPASTEPLRESSPGSVRKLPGRPHPPLAPVLPVPALLPWGIPPAHMVSAWSASSHGVWTVVPSPWPTMAPVSSTWTLSLTR